MAQAMVSVTPPVDAIITDIEGTTTKIAFVHEVLFPYARKHLRDFVAVHGHEPEVRGLLDAAKRDAGDPKMTDEAAIAALLRWIDEDRKATSLKGLQGLIWDEGFRAGAFQSHVYEDANEALRRWHAAGKKLYVYSSGSVTAQKLLFHYTPVGDLTALFSGFFDTTAGHKSEAESYRHIAKTIGLPPARIVFLTDAIKEVEAARAAGMQTVQLRRPGESQPKGEGPEAASFADINIPAA